MKDDPCIHSKIQAATTLVVAAHGEMWNGDQGDAVKAAAKFLASVLGETDSGEVTA